VLSNNRHQIDTKLSSHAGGGGRSTDIFNANSFLARGVIALNAIAKWHPNQLPTPVRFYPSSVDPEGAAEYIQSNLIASESLTHVKRGQERAYVGSA